jgi:hypothetical protein
MLFKAIAAVLAQGTLQLSSSTSVQQYWSGTEPLCTRSKLMMLTQLGSIPYTYSIPLQNSKQLSMSDIAGTRKADSSSASNISPRQPAALALQNRTP